MTISLDHFQTMLLFAFLVSVAFAFLSKRRLADRARYTLWAFLLFILIAVAIGWLMYPFSR